MNRIPVECIALMNPNEIRPLRVRYEVKDRKQVVRVDRIIQKDKDTVFATMNKPRSTEYTFRCEAIQEGVLKPFKLSYNDQSCRWYMYIS